MVKVLFEPAKVGSSNPSMKTGFSVHNYNNSAESAELEDSPKRISIFQCHQKSGFSKESGLDSGPLRRFLKTNIGRPWDKVYGDFCRRIDKRTYTGNEALECLKKEVFTDCVLGDDGEIYAKFNVGHYTQVYGFFVHPRTKLLQWTKPYNYQAERPAITKIEFLSSIEVQFWGKNAKFPYELALIRKIKLSFPSHLYSKRYAKTVLEKRESGWQIEYHESYDPEEIISREKTPEGLVVKRRKDFPNLPKTHIVKTKTSLNSGEIAEINRLLSLLDRKQNRQSDSASTNCRRPSHSYKKTRRHL